MPQNTPGSGRYSLFPCMFAEREALRLPSRPSLQACVDHFRRTLHPSDSPTTLTNCPRPRLAKSQAAPTAHTRTQVYSAPSLYLNPPPTLHKLPVPFALSILHFAAQHRVYLYSSAPLRRVSALQRLDISEPSPTKPRHDRCAAHPVRVAVPKPSAIKPALLEGPGYRHVSTGNANSKAPCRTELELHRLRPALPRARALPSPT